MSIVVQFIQKYRVIFLLLFLIFLLPIAFFLFHFGVSVLFRMGQIVGTLLRKIMQFGICL